MSITTIPALLSASLLCACGGKSPATPVNSVTPVAPGISLELAQQRKATVSDLRYRFSLTIPAEPSEAVTGTVEVSFHWRDADAREVVLDFKDAEHRVHRVDVNGTPAVVRYEADHLIIPPQVLEADAVNRLLLEITAGDDALNRNDGFLYTLFVPDRAHFSLPVFDQPDLKARVTWDL
ncbi:MAG: hypothetical protein JSW21_11810, partial [Gammaproteobacteria bacterium]